MTRSRLTKNQSEMLDHIKSKGLASTDLWRYFGTYAETTLMSLRKRGLVEFDTERGVYKAKESNLTGSLSVTDSPSQESVCGLEPGAFDMAIEIWRQKRFIDKLYRSVFGCPVRVSKEMPQGMLAVVNGDQVVVATGIGEEQKEVEG